MTKSEDQEEAAESASVEPHVAVIRIDGTAKDQLQQLEPTLRERNVYAIATSADLDTTRFAEGARQLVTLVRSTAMDRLISALSPVVGIPTPAVLEQARRNVTLREEFLAEFGGLTAREVADLAGSSASNRAQYAHSLSRAGRIFAITHRRHILYPAFQFSSEGEPLPVIADALVYLRERFQSEWEIALWFTSPNAWLEGERPVDLLEALPSAVMEAAHLGSDRSGF